MTVRMDLGQADVHVDAGLEVRKDMTTQFELSDKLNTADDVKAEMSRLAAAKEAGHVADEDYAECCTKLSNAMNRFGDAIGDEDGNSHGKTMRGECVDVLLLSADDNSKQVWIQVAKQGKFLGHHSGRPFEMNAETFAQIIHNFKSTKNRAIPVDFEHASEQAPTDGQISTAGAPAQGWITDLAVRADGNLWGLVEWLPLAKKYIKAKQYRFLSPAIAFGAKDRVTGAPIGALLSSVALTNGPFLDGLKPLAAKQIHASAEYEKSKEIALNALRTALDLPETIKAPGMLAMMVATGHDSLPMSKVRDALRLPLTMADDQVFALAQIVCGKPIELPTPVLPAVSENQPTIMTATKEMVNMSDPNKELETKIAQLTLQKNEVDAEIKRLKDENATEITRLSQENAALVQKLAVHDDRELNDLVDVTIATYGEKMGLTESARPHLLTFAKGMREAFIGMYPPVPASQRHLGKTLAATHHPVERTDMGNGHDNVIRMSDLVKDENIPDVGTIANKKLAEAKAAGAPISRESAFAMAHGERTQLMVSAAKKRAGMGG